MSVSEQIQGNRTMDRKKYMTAVIRLAYSQAKGQTRNYLKRQLRKKYNESTVGRLLHPGLKTAAGNSCRAGGRIFLKKPDGSCKKHVQAGMMPFLHSGKIRKKQKRHAKIAARLLKYALRETRYS